MNDIEIKPIKPAKYILLFLLCQFTVVGIGVYGGLSFMPEISIPSRFEPHRDIFAATLLILAGILLIYSVKLLIWSKKQLAKNLDIAFSHLNLKSEPYLHSGRHYFRTIDGRRIDIYCRPIHHHRNYGGAHTLHYHGHSLEIYVSGEFNTRSSIGKIEPGKGFHGKTRVYMTNRISQMMIKKYGGEVVEMNDSKYGGYDIYAMDQMWTHKFLSDEEAMNNISNLLTNEPTCSRHHVQVLPKALRLSLVTSIRNLTKGNIKRWAKNLLDLANIGERIGAASICSEETELERITRMEPDKLHGKVRRIFLYILLGIIIVVGTALYFII